MSKYVCLCCNMEITTDRFWPVRGTTCQDIAELFVAEHPSWHITKGINGKGCLLWQPGGEVTSDDITKWIASLTDDRLEQFVDRIWKGCGHEA